MAVSKARSYVTRDAVLGILSDAEVSAVSTSEGVGVLKAGQEYVDLENLDLGVQTAASDGAAVTSNVLLRDVVSSASWSQITALVKD